MITRAFFSMYLRLNYILFKYISIKILIYEFPFYKTKELENLDGVIKVLVKLEI